MVLNAVVLRGISEKNLHKIFSRFFQGENAPNQTGTGIGLALTKELVSLYNGHIYVSSDHYAQTYGNEIGQGISHKVFEQEVTISRVLQPHWGLMAEAGVQNSFIMSPEKKQQLYITFGIKTLLYREEKLF